MFVVIEEAFVILKTKGVYLQSKVYERNGKLYAKKGAGFILLNHIKGTSVPDVRWDDIYVPFKLKRTKVGYLANPKNCKEEMIDVKF